MAVLLIDSGAKVNLKQTDGYTPRRLALSLDQVEVASVLKEHGGR